MPSATAPKVQIKMQFNTAATITSVTLKRVPKGAAAGTVFTDSTNITFGGVSAAIPFVANVERVSDVVDITLDSTCDYYIVWHSATTNFQFKYFVDPTLSTYQKAGDNTSLLAVPDPSWTTSANGSYGVTGVIAAIPNMNTANSKTKTNWQILSFSPTTGWGSNKLTHRHLSYNQSEVYEFPSKDYLHTAGSGVLPTEKGDYLSRHVTGGLCAIAGRVVANSCFLSKGLVSYDGNALISVGFGGDSSIFDLTSETVVALQTHVNGSAVIVPTYAIPLHPTYTRPCSTQYYVHEQFTWAGQCKKYVGSDSYVDPVLLAAENGPIAASLSNRSLDGARFGKRGTSNNSDWYAFFGAMFTFRLGKPSICYNH